MTCEIDTTRTFTSRRAIATAAAGRGRARPVEILVAAALAVIALAFALAFPSGADAADKDPRYSDKRLEKWLKDELRGSGLEPKGISSCRPKRGDRVMVCKWRAKGTFPGDLPYECAGKARLAVQKRQWNVDPCNNIEEPRMPLRDGV